VPSCFQSELDRKFDSTTFVSCLLSSKEQATVLAQSGAFRGKFEKEKGVYALFFTSYIPVNPPAIWYKYM